MKKKEFVLSAVLFLVVLNTLGQPALPQTDEANVVVPIGHMMSVVALVYLGYGLRRLKK